MSDMKTNVVIAVLVVIELLATASLTLTSCKSEATSMSYEEAEGLEHVGFRLYRDEASDVLWMGNGHYMMPRLNADGTLMTYGQYVEARDAS